MRSTESGRRAREGRGAGRVGAWPRQRARRGRGRRLGRTASPAPTPTQAPEPHTCKVDKAKATRLPRHPVGDDSHRNQLPKLFKLMLQTGVWGTEARCNRACRGQAVAWRISHTGAHLTGPCRAMSATARCPNPVPCPSPPSRDPDTQRAPPLPEEQTRPHCQAGRRRRFCTLVGDRRQGEGGGLRWGT